MGVHGFFMRGYLMKKPDRFAVPVPPLNTGSLTISNKGESVFFPDAHPDRDPIGFTADKDEPL